MATENASIASLDELQDLFPPVSKEAWDAQIRQDLNGLDYNKKLLWQLGDGIAIHPFYRREDLARLATYALPVERLPGQNNAWHILEPVSGQTIEETRQNLLEGLQHGATAVQLTLRSPADLEALLEGIALAEVPLHLNVPGDRRPLVETLLQKALGSGMNPARLTGAISCDPLATLALTGRLQPDAAYQEVKEVIVRIKASGAGLRCLDVDLTPYHEAGATSAYGLALALATASEHLNQLSQRGLDADDVVARLRFIVPIGTSYFLEMARLRALRKLMPVLFRAYGVEDAPPLFIEVHTDQRSMTQYDAHGNMLRATTQASAAIVGGCDALLVRPFDTAQGNPPDELALRMARNLQLILKHEAHLDATRDPAAGSYYVEVLTDHLARKAWEIFQDIEVRGGLLNVLPQGDIQARIASDHARDEARMASGLLVQVGINAYPDFHESLEHGDAEDVAEVKKILADSAGVVTAEVLAGKRLAESFEAIRGRTDLYAKTTGHRPSVFLLPVGHPAMANARATFTQNFFGCAGFRILENTRFASVAEGVAKAQEAQPDLVVLCSADEAYPEKAAELCNLYQQATPRPLLLIAGLPTEGVEAIQAAGIDGMIHRKMNLVETLTQYQQTLGLLS